MAHINELIDFTVEVFVVYKNKVLFRYHDKYDLWLSVGGHIEPNENPNEAAIREVKEEVGLDVVLYDKLRPFVFKDKNYEELIPPYFLNIHRVSDKHRHVTLNYFAKSDSDQIVETSHDKSGKCKWMIKEEIENNDEIHFQKKIYALKALEELASEKIA